MIYFLCFILFSIGIYGVLVKRNIIKLIISTMILNYAVYILLVLMGFRWQGQAPVFAADQGIGFMVDPLPQSMVMVSMIVGLAVTALLVAVAMRLYQEFKTFDLKAIIKTKIKNKPETDDNA
ncbi:MAG: sodium:proton antiporter [Candidatus Omnitrophica bacterium]|nr:sodium:proton antiporter [Candidatus Omnitrophota bacterium]